MKEILIMLAASLEENEILEKLSDAISQYQYDKSEDNKHHIVFYCQVFIIAMMTNGKMDKAMELINQMQKMDKMDDLLNTSDN